MENHGQCKRILEFCKKHGFITNKEAVQFLNCYRLSARIYDLEGLGVKFDHQMVYYKDRSGDTKHYMKYWLVE